MTPFEGIILRYMELRGWESPVSWAELRNQFGLSEGALQVVIRSLKRHLLVEQDMPYFRATSQGKVALIPKVRRQAFEGRATW